MFACKFCGKKFKSGRSLGGHTSLCNFNPKSINKKPFSEKRKENISKALKEYIKSHGQHKQSEKTKKILSLQRKKWLSENKNKHNWSLYKNQQTEPEKRFELVLKSNNIKYMPYYIPIESEHNYEIDFAILEEKIGFEINGNQHYNSDGTFTEYHINRKKYLESIGWKIIDIHYLKCFNNEVVELIIKCRHSQDGLLNHSL